MVLVSRWVLPHKSAVQTTAVLSCTNSSMCNLSDSGQLDCIYSLLDDDMSVIVGHPFRNKYVAAFAVIKSQNSQY
jgi:hypothetical protein